MFYIGIEIINRKSPRISGSGTIGWQKSALDRRKFYDTEFPNFARPPR